VASSFFLFLGAILSYVVFTNYWDGFAAGAILSFAAGILFVLGTNVILPLAFKLDPGNQVASSSFLAGVLIIFVASSILSYAGHSH
jgi:zinc transporter ZupT